MVKEENNLNPITQTRILQSFWGEEKGNKYNSIVCKISKCIHIFLFQKPLRVSGREKKLILSHLAEKQRELVSVKSMETMSQTCTSATSVFSISRVNKKRLVVGGFILLLLSLSPLRVVSRP